MGCSLEANTPIEMESFCKDIKKRKLRFGGVMSFLRYNLGSGVKSLCEVVNPS